MKWINDVRGIGANALVAQVSKPAVSPTSKSAGCPIGATCEYLQEHFLVRTICRLKACETADWKVCATKSGRSHLENRAFFGMI